MPSEPKAFVGCICYSAEIISSFVYVRDKPSFMARVIQFFKRLSKSIGPVCPEVVNIA